MKWTILFAALLGVCFASIQKEVNEASTRETATAKATVEAGIANTDDSTGEFETAGFTRTAFKTSTSDPDGIAIATGKAGISQKPNPPSSTTPDIIEITFVSDSFITPTPTTPTTPKTTAKTTVPTVDTCDICTHPDFMGFGFKAGKCGCCPWPCCCKCVGMVGEQGECRSLLDMAFIMDDSGSISAADWEVAKQFFIDVVSTLVSIGTDHHVSSVTFSTNSTLNWHLDDPQTATKEALTAAILGLERTGGFTNTAEAIERATNEVFVAPHDNPIAPNVAIVMTDGRANFRRNEIADLAEALRRKARTICIGVTNEVDMDELKMICDDVDIFTVVNFAELETIIKAVQREICPEPPKTEKCFCCCTSEQFWGNGGAKYYSGR